ncbi:hypothetical protein FZEAL_6181 [Fusarium zealandicum]|uniref:Ceramide glucosyltransferase n=1 Tax=Fusarium zealandicum TaxID=1053134 RepID=A0A8H4XJW2_9HYPO|nr:hypothetical protein FZEAL_6181 [Fusarium zealandicum]
MYTYTQILAAVCLILGIVVVVVICLGVTTIFRNVKHIPGPPVSPDLGQNAPHVTIIRPVKGIEPRLYECIASSFRQAYPQDRFSVRLCIENDRDTAWPILQKVIDDFPTVDACIMYEEEDAALDHTVNMGPNPKIRNLSRAYREAKGDIIWVVDCNVWMGASVMGRMVDKLSGFKIGGSSKPYKFVHQLPIVVDLIDYSTPQIADDQSLLAPTLDQGFASDTVVSDNPDTFQRVKSQGGGRLDEMFMATAHAKFYSGINTSKLAPCVVGKSNMFRKSQLEHATNPAKNPNIPQDKNLPTGVDYFSHNICEDHLIGHLLWLTDLPGFRNHGLVWGDIAVQPMSGMSVRAYTARRIRWLRARKYTVLSATILEPFTESFMFSTYFSFALTTWPYFQESWGIPPTWNAMALAWLFCIITWVTVDWFTFCRLHSGISMEIDDDTPRFAKGSSSQGGLSSRRFLEWLAAWLGREAFALPIWAWAVICGSTVNWRGKSFYVQWDTTVLPVNGEERTVMAREVRTPELERGTSRNKHRVD